MDNTLIDRHGTKTKRYKRAHMKIKSPSTLVPKLSSSLLGIQQLLHIHVYLQRKSKNITKYANVSGL